jgi:hypothetical protein
MTTASPLVEWVLLTYRIPREPSTPRSSVWRRLRRLGVVQLADGLVALPADARTREQLEWVADSVREAHGSAGVWLAVPTSKAQQRELGESMARARAVEYAALEVRARGALHAAPATRRRTVQKLRGELRQIRRRDFFPPPERDTAVAAVEELAASLSPADSSDLGDSASAGLSGTRDGAVSRGGGDR